MKSFGWTHRAWVLAVILGLMGASCATQLGNRPLGDTETRGHGDTETAAVSPTRPVAASQSPRPLPAKEPATVTKAKVQAAYGKLPLHFEANQGQTDADVKFLSRGSGYTLFLTPTEAVLALRQPAPLDTETRRHGDAETAFTQRKPELETRNSQLETVLHMHLVSANPNPQVEGLEELPGKSNYFIGNDPKKWRTNIPTYARVRYQNVYPGIDLVYYGNERQLEHDFIVAPGADPKAIKFAFKGADKVEIDAQGDLILQTASGEVRLHKPLIYQEINGVKHPISGGYALLSPQSSSLITFHVAVYDTSQPLTIDPVLIYSTLLGGSVNEFNMPDAEKAHGIAVDSFGNAYVSGVTDATDFPVANNTSGGGNDAFVAKLDPAGSHLLYSTYLGGGGGEGTAGSIPIRIAVDAAGSAYVAGQTTSTDFPGPGGTATTLGDGGIPDVFVTKLNASGSALLYSTYFGGNGQDQAEGIAVDASGNIYVMGTTLSDNGFPTKNAYQATNGGMRDFFVAKLDPSKVGDASLLYSTYLGGIGFDENDGGHGLAVDASGNAYVTGNSLDFPTTPNAYDRLPDAGSGDVVVAKLDPSKVGDASLLYSTYLGGSDLEGVRLSIAVDADGNAYVTGSTDSDVNEGFPTKNPISGTDCPGTFVAKFDPSPSTCTQVSGEGVNCNESLVYSTCDAGGGTSIAVDPPGRNVYLDNKKLELPPTNQLVSYPAGFGGIVALDASCNVYATGATSDPNFPLKSPLSPFQPFLLGDSDAYVQKIGEGGPFAYITNSGDNTVSVIDTANKDIIATVNVGNGPRGVAVSPDGTRVYVTNQLNDNVSVIEVDYTTDPPTHTVGANPIPVGDGPGGVADSPTGVAVSPDGTRVYVANFGSDSLSVIDTTTNPPTVTPITAVGDGPNGVAMHPDGSKVYVTNQLGDSITIITTANNQKETVQLEPGDEDGPLGVAVTPDGSKVYVTNGPSNTVKVINTTTNGVTEITVGDDPRGVVVSPDGSKVYVVNNFPLGCSGGNSVSVIDTNNDQPMGPPIQLAPTCTCPVPGAPPVCTNVPFLGSFGVSVHPDGTRVYVANQFDNSVSVIDTATNTVVDADIATVGVQGIEVGNGPIAFGQFISFPVDKDLDGIWDLVDRSEDGVQDQSMNSNNKTFSNKHLCGTTFGSIVDVPSGMAVKVISPAGLGIGAFGGDGTQQATVNACGFDLLYDPNDVTVIDSCGSLTAQVLMGPVEVLLGTDIVLTVPPGATVRVKELADGWFVKHLGNIGMIVIESQGQMIAQLDPGGSVILTPAGANVEIQVDSVTLTFDQVTQAGTTNLTTSNTGPPPASGFQLGDPPTYYELETTALFSGNVQVCIDYSGISFTDESMLKLFHFEGDLWVDVTDPGYPDTINTVICGTVSSLSPFAIFEPGDSDGDGVFDGEDLCSDTPSGDVVNADGCSIDQLCPCAAPWKNHGEYVSCVTQAAEALVNAGQITGEEKGAIVSKAAQSNCGQKKK